MQTSTTGFTLVPTFQEVYMFGQHLALVGTLHLSSCFGQEIHL